MTNSAGQEISTTTSKEFQSFIRIGLQSIERLGRVLFDEQEQMLPNGDVWEELDENDKSFWISSAASIMQELQKIVEEQTKK